MKDFIIAGAGLTGSVLARELTDAGYSCLIADKRSHVAGNIFSQRQQGIETHVYGPHIFHTNSQEIWDYLNRFTQFNDYKHKVKAIHDGKLYSLPFNLQTAYEITGCYDPVGAFNRLTVIPQTNTLNLEAKVLSTLGVEIYETLIKDYTTKQWGRHPSELPAFIINRLPVRHTFNDRYYNHVYEGIPVDGYTSMIQNMQDGIEVALDLDITYSNWRKYGKRLIYTGPVDAYYAYTFGALEYRSLRFETKTYLQEYYQGCAQVNLCDMSAAYTRTVEHKHFTDVKTDYTLVTYEYPAKLEETGERYYPIENNTQLGIVQQYKRIKSSVLFAGRLGNYKYYDMDQAVGAALRLARSLV